MRSIDFRGSDGGQNPHVVGRSAQDLWVFNPKFLIIECKCPAYLLAKMIQHNRLCEK